MNNYNIYFNTVVYMALYLKSQYQKGTQYVGVTKKQVDTYWALVKKNIDDVKVQSGNSFDYRILQGEQGYNFTGVDERVKRLMQNTKFYLSKDKKMYYTDATEEGLALKSINTLPMPLTSCFTPNGFEQALDVYSPISPTIGPADPSSDEPNA